jgi:molybdate transport system substrate-binding protein
VEPVLVYAAADLEAAFRDLVPRYEQRGGGRVALVLGSTGNLTAQIEQGAPADAFFAANERFIDRLGAGGLIEEGSRRVYARGRIALVWGAGAPVPADPRDLARPEYRSIAIANPEHAPYGVAAREALQALGIWDRLRPRLVYGENIAQALQFVASRNAEAGIVALGLVTGPRARPHLLIDAGLHAPLRQAAGVIRGSPRADRALRFLEYVMSDEGQAILREYGFEEP